MDLATLNATDMILTELHNNHTFYVCFSIYCDVTSIVHKFVAPLMLLAGCVGNLLSIVVLSSRNFRTTTTGFYLIALAIADLFVLILGEVRWTILGWYDVDIRAGSRFLCKSLTFLAYLSTQLSAAFIMIVSIDRLVGVRCSMKASHIMSKSRAWIFTALIVGVSFSFNCHIIFKVDIRYQDGLQTCDYAKDGATYMQFVVYADFFLNTLLPFIVITICNMFIVNRIRTARKERTHMMSNESSDMKRRRDSTMRFLLILNIVFIALTLPFNVVMIINRDSPNTEPWFFMVYDITFQLFYSNNACNFLLYCVSGRKFRIAVTNIFSKLVGSTRAFFTTRATTKAAAAPIHNTASRFFTRASFNTAAPRDRQASMAVFGDDGEIKASTSSIFADGRYQSDAVTFRNIAQTRNRHKKKAKCERRMRDFGAIPNGHLTIGESKLSRPVSAYFTRSSYLQVSSEQNKSRPFTPPSLGIRTSSLPFIDDVHDFIPSHRRSLTRSRVGTPSLYDSLQSIDTSHSSQCSIIKSTSTIGRSRQSLLEDESDKVKSKFPVRLRLTNSSSSYAIVSYSSKPSRNSLSIFPNFSNDVVDV